MKYVITLDNKDYEVQVELAEPMLMSEFGAYAPAAAPAPVAEPAAAPAPVANSPVVSGEGEAVKSPMPGTILKVSVQAGQTVKEGELLCVLEAMKMENEIFSPKSGTVKQVLVTKGSTVDTDAPLVVIG